MLEVLEIMESEVPPASASKSLHRYFPGTRIHSLSLHKNCENSSMFLSRIHHFFQQNGYLLTDRAEDAEVVLINTCSTTDELVANMEEGIDGVLAAYPGRQYLVIGCFRPFSGATAVKFAALEGRLGFVDVFNLELLDNLFFHTIPARAFAAHDLAVFQNYQQAITQEDVFLHVSTGCAFSCTYCNIKIAKGQVQSRPLAELVEQTRALVSAGVRELVLLSDDCGSYGLDRGLDLVDLIGALLELEASLKLKIYNCHPTMFCKYWDRLKPLIATGRFSYLCLPLQSGSSRILKMMGRHYDLDQMQEIIGSLREISSRTHLYSHFMLNFPTETPDEFQASMRFARLFDACLFIPFGSNRRTPAVEFGPPGPIENLQLQREYILRMMKRGEVGGILL